VVTNPDGSGVHQEVFVEGWLMPDESVWGRPDDVLPMPDGSLLISDDHAGAIYRVTYTAP
jgi:glucose/arabinose dehydrogenase